MDPKDIQDLLPFLEQPSRYLGSEANRCLKDIRGVQLHMALAFPDIYEIGMSHFGIQILYHILNKNPGIYAERVFAPGEDLADRLIVSGLPLTTLETKTPLHQLDIVGFSLLYEMNYSNVLFMLELGKIPFLSKDRKGKNPLVIAGGPCTCNPEPVADFFDAMVIGEAETVIQEIAAQWLHWKASGRDREALLNQWSTIKGVYIPSLFEPEYDTQGFQHLKPRFGKGWIQEKIVSRAVVDNLTDAPFPLNPIVPFAKPVHDRLRLEIARGCTRGCRFCQAGFLYRPARERSPDTLLHIAKNSLARTGFDNISLLSLSTGDYTNIGYLMKSLMNGCEESRVAISLPSLRAGTLTPELMHQIQRVRKTGFTIAPEAGSQRLRNIINKNISETEIIETVKDAFGMGWRVIKLYFMIGLPQETQEDIDAIVDLVRKLKWPTGARSGGKGKGQGKINVSVATFIPKPHTPFQWEPQIPLVESRRKIHYLREALDLQGIQFKWQNPELSLLEGLWARGDRRLSKLLTLAHRRGCRFDGWSDHFRFDLWMEAISEAGIDLDFFTTRPRDLSEPLPWDIVDIGVTPEFLKDEFNRAKILEKTWDCRFGACNTCGVCDFESLQPEIHRPKDPEKTIQKEKGDSGDAPGTTPDLAYRFYYSKLGPARFFGHLELVKLMLQAIHRAGILVAYSKGYHPKPKISFGDPLPVGMESQREVFDLHVARRYSLKELIKIMNENLPEGIRIDACKPVDSHNNKIPVLKTIRYRISISGSAFDEGALEAFQKAEKWEWEKTDGKGRLKSYELKDMVLDIKRISSDTLELELKNESGKTLRPGVWIGPVFQIPDKALKSARILRLDNGKDDV